MSEKKYIKIRGARVHNLKDLSLDIPMNKLVVITGVSGSGKSSLAFDTLFAEGQRRYVESLSSYARQFLGRINKPDVDTVEGIAPAIAVEQKVSGRNPRSTVGTTTEIYDYMKLLFARIGRLYSPVTGEPVERYEVTDVVRKIEERPHRGRITVAAGVVLEPGQSLIEKITLIVGDGYDRMLYKGRVCDIAEVMADIDTLSAEDLAVVVDRMDLADWSDELMARLADSVNIAMSMTYGKVIVADMDANGLVTSSRTYSRAVETQDGVDYIVPNEHLFSFNSPLGACPVCEGYGKTVGIDENLVVPNKNKSVYDNAIACWNGETMKRWKERVIDTAEASGFPIHRPYNRLSDEERAMLWHGCRFFKGIDAFFAMLEKEKYKIQYRALISRYTGKRVCPECGGGRLRICTHRRLHHNGYGWYERIAPERDDGSVEPYAHGTCHSGPHTYRDKGASELSRGGGVGLSHHRPSLQYAFRRGEPAYKSRHLARQRLSRLHVHTRRAEHRSASA